MLPNSRRATAPSQFSAYNEQAALQADINPSDGSEGGVAVHDSQFLTPDGSVYNMSQDYFETPVGIHFSPDSATSRSSAIHTSRSWTSTGGMNPHSANQSPNSGPSSRIMGRPPLPDSKPLKRYSACHTCRRRKLVRGHDSHLETTNRADFRSPPEM